MHCCSTASVIADCYTNYIGALVGRTTGISDTLESYYCLAASLISADFTEHRQEISPAVAIDWSVGRGVNGVGESYSGSVSLKVQVFVDENIIREMSSHFLHETLMTGCC